MYFFNNALKIKASAILSFLIGFITAILNHKGILVLNPYVLWISLCFGITLFSTYIWIAAFSNCENVMHYLKQNFKVLTLGSFGIILTSVILLATTRLKLSLFSSVMAGFLFFSLALVLITTIRFVIFVAND